MVENLKKWSILTKKFKELDITLKMEYIRRYGRKFYEKQAENGIYNNYRNRDDGFETDYSPTKIQKED